MNHELAWGSQERRRRARRPRAGRGFVLRLAFARAADEFAVRWRALSPAVRLSLIALAGGAAAAGVAYLTSLNPRATPGGAPVAARVGVIVTLIATGIYAQTSRVQAPMGVPVILAGFFSALWLLNGSAASVPFTIGMVAGVVAPTVFCYLMLAHPLGRLSSEPERRLLRQAGGVLGAAWILLVVGSSQPPLVTPLLRCAPHCPHNLLYLGVGDARVHVILKAVAIGSWAAMALGTAVLLLRRWRAATLARRQALTPVLVAAGLYAVLPIFYFGARSFGWPVAGSFGAGVVALAIMAPVAILVGLGRERFFVVQAVADFVGRLARDPDADPQTLMAAALGDPTLQIAYWRPKHRTYVNRLGLPTAGPQASRERAVTWIQRERRPVAAISYNADLLDQERFVQAAGYAALMHLESTQLEADLRASTADVEASRIRLVEAAHEERKRIERDLHDSVQQELVALRIKLEMAADALGTEPARGERMVHAVGRQIDDVLETLRNIARGIYPSLLQERGIGPALSAAAQRLPLPVAVRASTLARYHEDIEVAVYFCCLEALQNVVKHAGPGAEATVSIWIDGDHLRFEVSDTGRGFAAAEAGAGNGLTNMRDRIDAVGGTLEIGSSPELGTRVKGWTPVTPSDAQWPMHAAAQGSR